MKRRNGILAIGLIVIATASILALAQTPPRKPASPAGTAALRAVRDELVAARTEGLERASVTHILQGMIDRGHAVVAVDIHKGWMEIDSFDDYRRAWAEVGR